MNLKFFSGIVLVCMLFIAACEDQGDPVTPVIPPSNNPAISSIVPDSGIAGDTVTINGANFGTAQGASTVSFGSVNAAIILSWNDAQIIVVVPANSVTGNLSVTVESKTSNSAQFTIIGSVATVSFATDVLQNVFRKGSYGCTGCHGGTNNLFLNSYAEVMQGNSTRGPIVEAGDTTSLLIRKLKGGTFLGPTEGDRMPQNLNPISDSDLRNVVAWIKDGAQNN